MKDEFEIISYNNINNFRVFLVNMLYRSPHIHLDFEICLVLDGELTMYSLGMEYHAKKGDLFVLNPLQPHELKSSSTTLILSVQISPTFFQSHYPPIQNLNFVTEIFPAEKYALSDYLQKLAHSYFSKQNGYELECVGILNLLFFKLLQISSCKILSETEHTSYRLKKLRIRRIAEYIDDHYSEKLLLSDLAEQEGLTVPYLSHFFKNCFEIPFQEYLMKIRCEKARQLLLLTDHSLLDISISCGFSDPKYFNQGFLRQYGYTPKQYRQQFKNAKLPVQQSVMLTTQEFLSEGTSLVLLEKYINENHESKNQ